jgi:hypothetical protein
VTEFAVLVPALIGLNGEWLGRRRRGAHVVSLLVAALAGLGAGAILEWGVPMGREGLRKPGLGISPKMVPDQAALFLRQVDTEGRLFNILGFGGYLIHELWPGRQVYVDGRLDVFPDGFLRSYGRMVSTGVGWEEACANYGINLAVVDLKGSTTDETGLHRKLRTDPEWSCVFISHNALVYARHAPENEALLARFACPLRSNQFGVESIRRFVEEATPQAVAQAISSMTAMTEVAPRDKFLLAVLGVLLDASGRSADGADRIRQAIQLAPDSIDARILLVWVLLRAGSLADANTELNLVLASEPRRVDALMLLADLRQREGNVDAAMRALREAEAIRPGDATVEHRLEELRRQTRGEN